MTQDSNLPLPNLQEPDVAFAGTVRDAPSSPKSAADLEQVFDVPVTVSAVLGRSQMPFGDLLKIGPGAVLELDRKVGEAIDILREQPAGGARRGRPRRGPARRHHDGDHQGRLLSRPPLREPSGSCFDGEPDPPRLKNF